MMIGGVLLRKLCPTRTSHGARSSSVSGWPAAIFSRLASGCRSSPSMNCAETAVASAAPMEDFPHPDTPIMTKRSIIEMP